MTEEEAEDYSLEEATPISCRACESEFVVILADDMLGATPNVCPFCAEPIVE